MPAPMRAAMASHVFNIEVEPHDAGVVVHMRGEADGAHAEHLHEHLFPVLDTNPLRVVLNMAELIFINSLGLGALVEFRNELASRGGQLRLSGVRDRVREVLTKTRLCELFPMFDTPDAALAG